MKKFSKIQEALRTPCQTEGAVYEIEISEDEVEVEVKLPFKLELSEEEAKMLENNLHNAVELVLSSYFPK